MTKIYLLTAPFDEEARTGDGQYAESLEAGFKRNYPEISCKWLKKDKGDYSIPFPADTTSIPSDTIPSAAVLQPVANQNTIISGYKLKTALANANEAENVNAITVSPKTPKIVVGHDNKLHSLTIMDIYSKQPIKLDLETVRAIKSTLIDKNEALKTAISDNEEGLSKFRKLKLKRDYLIEAYEKNDKNIKDHCTLNEYLEAHLDNKSYTTRYQKALSVFGGLESNFTRPEVDTKELEKLTDKLTGVRDYVYDFQTGSLTYDIEKDNKFNQYYYYEGLKNSVDDIKNELEKVLMSRETELLNIREAVADKYPYSYYALSTTEGELEEKRALINLIYKSDYQEIYDEETFLKALIGLYDGDLSSAPIEEVKKAIGYCTEVSNNLNNRTVNGLKKEERSNVVSNLQSLLSMEGEPYSTLNSKLKSCFYGKRKLSASEGFQLAYQANQRDPLKPKLITDMIEGLKPIDDETYLDVHIRPPDCGVFITAKDIETFQKAGIKVNITIHEYKQNYTRRYLQQYTHDLMRQADSVQFFNAMDRDNAIIAATYGDCDKRNTTEPSGKAKKEREVGEDFELDKYPVETYKLKEKSGLTVASQQLSSKPAHVKDVIKKEPNILSFGTIRPGKGFEEALTLAQLVKEDAESISEKIVRIPTVKLAGDPQDKDLMQNIVEERFGVEAVKQYQRVNKYSNEFTNSQRRNYWKLLVKNLNEKVSHENLNNPYLEIYPWCEDHELKRLKDSCKYVCRMDDMGMRNNGSAIISVLDVGIVYTKFGSVTDDIYIKGGKYGNAVDIGEYRFGKYSLLKKEKEFIKENGIEKALPKWLVGNPDSTYKRQSESRDPKEILNSIIAREENQLQTKNVKESENYQTVVEAQKLLNERFTLRNAVEHLLDNIGLNGLIKKAQPHPILEVDPLAASKKSFGSIGDIRPKPTRTKSLSDISMFSSRREELHPSLNKRSESSKIDVVGKSSVIVY